ncbi:MAG: lipopolysaccharide assembly protein LapA domain-containing protein [Gemmatimonadota bacterium]
MLDRRALQSLTQLLALVLCAAVILFAFLNTQPVTVDLYVTQVRSSVALLVLGSLLGGILLGWSGARRRDRIRRRTGAEPGLEDEGDGPETLTDQDASGPGS